MNTHRSNGPGGTTRRRIVLPRRLHPTERPEQAVRELREGERPLNEGKDLVEVLWHLEIAESTWNRWRNQYGSMNVSQAKRLR